MEMNSDDDGESPDSNNPSCEGEEENESDDDGDVVEADFEVLDSDDEDTDE